MGEISLADVRDAADALRGHVERTPCLHSRTLSEIAGCELWLKFENLQFTASFKERGALNKLRALSAEQRAAGVIAMSGGNHAQGVALHARRLGIHACIVMPRFTPSVKVEQTRALGAEVELVGESVEDAAARAAEIQRERGGVFVHPYDDAQVIAGQGTVALEMLEDAPELDALVVPVGGGGLISGCALAARAISPKIEVYGVQAARFPSMKQALEGAPIRCGSSTLANGIAVKAPGSLTLPIVRRLVREILLVEEEALESALLLLLEVEKTVAEGAGGAALAALLAHPSPFAGKRVGVVISGGNIDMLVLSHVIERGLARTSRLARLLVRMRDVPGELAAISRVIAESGANVVQVLHERAFARAPSSEVEVEFVIETRGADHLRDLVARLASSGHETRAEPR
ncbi:MAG TPA: threonine ammonia-lyase [Myxococcota bacterium]|nr:threonine ammonia-lyase [Myxococcota bacterium]